MPPSHPYPRRRRARRFAAVAALLIPIVAIAAFFLVRSRDDSAAKSRAAVTAFAAAWSRGDDDAAARLTDSPAAAQALKANRAGLDGAQVAVKAGAAHGRGRQGDRAAADHLARAVVRPFRLHRAGHRDQDRGRPLARPLQPAHDPPAPHRQDPPGDELPTGRSAPASSIATDARSSRSGPSCASACSATRSTDIDESANALANRARHGRQGPRHRPQRRRPEAVRGGADAPQGRLRRDRGRPRRHSRAARRRRDRPARTHPRLRPRAARRRRPGDGRAGGAVPRHPGPRHRPVGPAAGVQPAARRCARDQRPDPRQQDRRRGAHAQDAPGEASPGR